MKNKKKNLNPITQGLQRIEEIKNNIASLSRPKMAKAQVYEIWQNIFETEE